MGTNSFSDEPLDFPDCSRVFEVGYGSLFLAWTRKLWEKKNHHFHRAL